MGTVDRWTDTRVDEWVDGLVHGYVLGEWILNALLAPRHKIDFRIKIFNELHSWGSICNFYLPLRRQRLRHSF
jgi:hypothetical protein